MDEVRRNRKRFRKCCVSPSDAWAKRHLIIEIGVAGRRPTLLGSVTESRVLFYQ